MSVFVELSTRCKPLSPLPAHLKLCMSLDVFGPLSAEDELRLVGHPHQVVLHSVTQKSAKRETEGVRETERERDQDTLMKTRCGKT